MYDTKKKKKKKKKKMAVFSFANLSLSHKIEVDFIGMRGCVLATPSPSTGFMLASYHQVLRIRVSLLMPSGISL
jgi:hypothetical protein